MPFCRPSSTNAILPFSKTSWFSPENKFFDLFQKYFRRILRSSHILSYLKLEDLTLPENMNPTQFRQGIHVVVIFTKIAVIHRFLVWVFCASGSSHIQMYPDLWNPRLREGRGERKTKERGSGCGFLFFSSLFLFLSALFLFLFFSSLHTLGFEEEACQSNEIWSW